ncbi:MAG: ATP-binding protein [Dehalococcoidia bacterium]|nr:MAG: ATP-binding protein [Dehalococcoidia bacterium]
MKLNIFRGLPGSGKSTIAAKYAGPLFEADQFFMEAGQYKFNPSKLKEAHSACRRSVEDAMKEKIPTINVANTNTQLWEVQSYLNLAEQHGYDVELIHVKGDWGSAHNVPEEAIQSMAARWQPIKGEKVIDNNKTAL